MLDRKHCKTFWCLNISKEENSDLFSLLTSNNTLKYKSSCYIKIMIMSRVFLSNVKEIKLDRL